MKSVNSHYRERVVKSKSGKIYRVLDVDVSNSVVAENLINMVERFGPELRKGQSTEISSGYDWMELKAL